MLAGHKGRPQQRSSASVEGCIIAAEAQKRCDRKDPNQRKMVAQMS